MSNGKKRQIYLKEDLKNKKIRENTDENKSSDALYNIKYSK